ncbi:hypothetical protein THAOC_05613, partial [Thalassiosira oceanica]
MNTPDAADSADGVARGDDADSVAPPSPAVSSSASHGATSSASLGSASADSDAHHSHLSFDRSSAGPADFFADVTLDMSDARDFSTPRTDA